MLLWVGYVANYIRLNSVPGEASERWHEPPEGGSFEAESAFCDRADLVTILVHQGGYRQFHLYGVRLPVRGGQDPPLGTGLASSGDDGYFKVIVRKRHYFQPSEVEIVTADGRSINQLLGQAGVLHNDAEVQEALVSFRYSSEQSREAVAATYQEEARDYVQTHDWKKALDAAKGIIHAKPTMAEGYRIAGLAAGQIYGLGSDESRFYYVKYVALEPDTNKTAFVKDVFPDLISKQTGLTTSHP